MFFIVFEDRPFWLQHEIILKIRFKRHENKLPFSASCGHGFFIDFWMILGWFWGSKSIQNEMRKGIGHGIGKKRVQDRLETLQDASWGSKKPQEADLGPKRPQLGLTKRMSPKAFGPPKSALAPRGLPRPIFHRFWTPKRPQNHEILDLQTIPKSLKIDWQSIPNSLNIDANGSSEPSLQMTPTGSETCTKLEPSSKTTPETRPETSSELDSIDMS